MEFFNKELSWLSFNERVLQESLDQTNPLIERIRFLGIYSNNLDEFFRVKVANVKRLIEINKTKIAGYKGTPKQLLKEIEKVVLKQQQTFELSYQKILGELKEKHILQATEKHLKKEDAAFIRNYFQDQIRPQIVPLMLSEKLKFPQLKDDAIYLGIKMTDFEKTKIRYALIEIPSTINRFFVLPHEPDEVKKVILLDDIIRFNLYDIFYIFNFDQIKAFTFKITRDAELDFDMDISKSFYQKMKKSVAQRKEGAPVRMVYDASMPIDLLNYLIKHLNLTAGENIIPGGRYHNFKDFMNFPDFGDKSLVYKKMPPLKHPYLKGKQSVIKTVLDKDVLLNYPYQQFKYVVNLLQEAAIDPKVLSIKINLYRVASNSQIINALINAAKNGKSVTVIIELLARFDEENNLKWAKHLEENGVIVMFGVKNLKVHSKLILIKRRSGSTIKSIVHIGTGNFHEKTANIYTDFSLLTSNDSLAKEVEKVFKIFKNNFDRSLFRDLIVSPFNSRRKLVTLIENEIKNANRDEEAYILIKLNNLVDTKLIKKLYEASNAGVKIKCIIRGMCTLVPGIKGQSENIEVRSIVGRFLEHTRLFIFANAEDEKYYISSADWMTRNIERRIEVAAPIFDESIQKDLKHLFNLQWKDNVKARIIDEYQKNKYFKNDKEPFNSQIEIYKFFKHKLKEI
ncbi:MAG TPA: polyphosphate kinase 1 [Crocinitomix sp.]|nr:polyphosphate kinase 1 [Crocinitomix sp.]